MAVSLQMREDSRESTRFLPHRDTPHGTTLTMDHTGSVSNPAEPGSTNHLMPKATCRTIYLDGEGDYL